MYSVTTGKVDGSSCGLTGAGGVVGSIILVLHEIAVRTNHSRWALEGNATVGLLVSLTTDHGRAVIFSFGSEQFVRQVKSRGWLWWSAATPQESLRHVKGQRCKPGAYCPSHPVLFSCL